MELYRQRPDLEDATIPLSKKPELNDLIWKMKETDDFVNSTVETLLTTGNQEMVYCLLKK